jgi:hypothetical protein
MIDGRQSPLITQVVRIFNSGLRAPEAIPSFVLLYTTSPLKE